MESKSAIAVLVSVLAVLITSPAGALTSKECSVKYQAAKSAGTLAGKTWNDFRKTECAANAPAAPTEPATKPAATTDPAKTTEPAKETAPTKPARNDVHGCRVPNRGVIQVLEREGGKGPHAHVPRSVQRQQGKGCQWRLEVDRERRRLLQRVQQAPEGLSPARGSYLSDAE